MKILSAIVLLLWTACYGRCLAEQNGLLKSTAEAWHCGHACCAEESDETPPPQDDDSPCHVCDFIKHGGVPTGQHFVLDAPVLVPLLVPVIEFAAVIVRPGDADEETIAVNDTGPPQRLRMCEWMASTATPVRGPNGGA